MDDRWFKAQQRRAGVTTADIARRLGRDRTLVSRLYVGRQKMTLDQARVFSEMLGVDLPTVLEKAGVAGPTVARTLTPGFSDSDVAPWQGQDNHAPGAVRDVARALGADRPGADIWRARTDAMALGGVLPGDFLLVDSHAAERCRAGDMVVAQIYNNAKAQAVTVLRRFEPPVLVAASCDPDDARVHVIDGVNCLVRGRVLAVWRLADAAA